MWADPATREPLQRDGVNVLPVNFYSNSPSIEEIRESFEYREHAPYLDERLFDGPSMLSLLAELQPFANEFTPGAEFWSNSQFSFSDALAYYSFIRKYRPQTIVEIGSGFSTLVALEAVKRNGFGRIICVEPYPRDFLRNANVELVQQPAQSVTDLNEWLTSDGDFLFIDSTHTVKTGSDCLHIYLRLLPKLQRRTIVHAHDIFLPFGLPQEWLLHKQIFWTEQYLLLALLTDNPRARVLWGSAYLQGFHNDALTRWMDGKSMAGGGSFWFEYLDCGSVAAAFPHV
ncbi:MAG TPA: class I SAM-dependent methyltransferase [Thermoanaerobaculia bacterium]|nr:class I SAM-dependent methyltransferase [Thermoanaerobaculia bacterium]